VIITREVGVYDISCWKLGRVVLMDEAFHVVMYISELDGCNLVVWVGGILDIGGGWEYSFKVSLHSNASVSKLLGRYGNLMNIVCNVSGSFVCLIKLYISL